MKRKNPTSPIRQGFDYQDLWGLRLCGDWLISPDKYQWISFETCPTDDLQGGFFLDDIVLSDSKGRYHLYQIKHKQNPEDDEWSWEDFLKRERGNNNQLRDSLLQKWFKSFCKPDLKDRIGHAAFVTNGLADDDIKNILKDDKMDIQTIQKQTPTLYEEIRTQLGNEEEIRNFFNSFKFLFGLDVIEKLVYEILYLLNQEVEFKPNRRLALIPPADYEPYKFFTKHIQGFLAPVYNDRSYKMTLDAGEDFFKYWAFNSKRLANELSIEEHVGDAMNFMGYRAPRMLSMSTKLSEVYRSAFLQSVQHFFDNGLLQIDMYHRYALATLPVELSFWKIRTNRAPTWWPKVKHETGKESYTKEIVKFAFPYNEIEAIVKMREKTTILGINGTAEPQKGWREGVPDTSIDLAGFAYKINGPNIPAAETIAKKILNETYLFTVPRIMQRPFNVLECPNQCLPSQGEPEAIDDIIIYPLIAPIRHSAISLWQWFRGNHPFMLLFRPVSDQNVMRLEDSGLHYYNKQGDLFAHSQDWSEGIQDRTDLEAPHGTFFEIDTIYLNEYLNEIGFRLGYVMRITHKIRKYSGDEEQSIEDCRLIGVSRIIT